MYVGRSRIQTLANRLNVPEAVVTMAYRYFKLAVNQGLTKGYKSQHMSAVCLFLACRVQSIPCILSIAISAAMPRSVLKERCFYGMNDHLSIYYGACHSRF